MAVYKRSYRGYAGSYTPEWSRFLILSRYASQGLFRSRFLLGFYVVCFFPFLVTAAMIYLNHSTSLLALLKVPGGSLVTVNNHFFRNYLSVQVSLAFILTAFVGPGLISPDLANNGLILYLCRPFTRSEYVMGKITVLARLLSFITWVPGLILFGIESSLSGASWMWNNLYIAGAIFAGSWILIAVLSLLALALSAWVKWKPVAGALVLGVMFLGAGFGAALNAVMRTELGHLMNLPMLFTIVSDSLFRIESTVNFPPNLAWFGLGAIAAGCLYLLSRRLRAFEVVR